MNNMQSMAGRRVLVTGASSGLGAHLAILMARAGAEVALGARRIEMLAGIQARIAAMGGIAISVPLDVRDEASVQSCYDEIDRVFGGIDSVVANAGTSIEGRALDIPVEQFDSLMAVQLRNLLSTGLGLERPHNRDRFRKAA